MCKGCGGGEICGHNNQRSSCKYGDPPEHLAKVVRGHVYTALKNHKEMGSTEYLGWISRRLKNILNKNLQNVCHGKITVNGTSTLRYCWNTINHHFKRLFNGCTTQIHSLCRQVKMCQKDVDIFLTDCHIWGIKQMTEYIKEPHTVMFIGQTNCGKIHLNLVLIEKEYNNHFD